MKTSLLPVLALACGGLLRGAEPPAAAIPETVLFAFDHASIPFTEGLRLHLISGKVPGQPNPIVVGRGQPGEPDDESVRFYGNVIRVGDELRLWYLARSKFDTDPHGQLRVCYATSTDGVHWVKPRLGLVEFHGSKANNIVALRGGRCELTAIPMVYDPDDPDPSRRYKMCFESWVYDNKFAVAYSPDGLTWKESEHNPVGPHLEQTGLIKYGGCYYVNGHGGAHFGAPRKMVIHASYDFELWTHASSLGFRRDNIPPRTMPTAWNAGEEVHLGAGLWDRGNVIVGVYDMWHGSPSSDRVFVGMDLGLVVSHDALEFQEPIPDFRLVPAYEEMLDYSAPAGNPAPISPNEYTMKVPLVRAPSLSHGQGLANWGDRTLLWYEVWGYGGIRLATWPRDRLGCLTAYTRQEEGREFRPGDSATAAADAAPGCITLPLRASGSARIFLNAAGLSSRCLLKVELLDEHFRPILGYSGASAAFAGQAGLRQPVEWKSGGKLPDSFRVKITFAGDHSEQAELYAIYLGD